MLCIIAIMAFLAQSTKIGVITIFGYMVEVRYRKNNLTAIIPYSVILNSTELAFVACAFKDVRANLFPITWIPFPIFCFYWHTTNFLLFGGRCNLTPILRLYSTPFFIIHFIAISISNMV